MKQRNISDFFENDVTNYSCYSTLRMIASAIDGLKNSSRKVIYTVLEKNIKNDMKVSVLDNVTQGFTQYLHGTCSGVIQNMAADYLGSNNLPLLKGQGNFGSRFVNEPAAPRYTYVKSQDFLNKIFDIREILIEQYFEGSIIEPKFYVPLIPLLLVNGSLNGLASGFKQHILPRKIDEIIKYMNGKKADLKPYIKDFKGSVRLANSDSTSNIQWEFVGSIEIKKNRVNITEIPPFIEYSQYLNILDNLVESKKIRSYKDRSDQKNQIYNFEVILFNELEEEKILELLKLIKKETEIYNALDENNKVRTFKNVEEILDYFIDVRKRFMEKQKEFLIKKYTQDVDMIFNKLRFIKLIIENKLKIMKRSQDDIEKDLIDLGFQRFENNFDYLLKMQIHSFTKDTLDKLTKDASKIKTEFETLKDMDMFKNYLETLKDIRL